MESYRIVVQAANQNTKFKFMKTIAFSLSMVSEATVRKNFVQTFPQYEKVTVQKLLTRFLQLLPEPLLTEQLPDVFYKKSCS